jgi:branched-chain amino acid transport system permease protein
MIIWGGAYRWTDLTGGENGIIAIPRPDLGLAWNLKDTADFYYFVFIFFSVILAAFFFLIKSPFGKTLVGIRDAANRMRVLGYNVWLHQYLALIIGGAIAGIGGNLYAYYNGFVGPTSCHISTAMEFILMVIIGGPGTLVGACIGAFIIVFLREIVSIYTTRWLMVLGVAYILTALYAPKGILGLWGSYFRKE